MIKLIVGVKGSGKTKTMIELVNVAAKETKGRIVCLEQGKKLIYDVKHTVRLVDVSEYNVTGFHTLLSFVSGILAADYDVTDIFIDSALKIGKEKVENMEMFLDGLKAIGEKNGCQFTVTVSADPDMLPEAVKAYC